MGSYQICLQAKTSNQLLGQWFLHCIQVVLGLLQTTETYPWLLQETGGGKLERCTYSNWNHKITQNRESLFSLKLTLVSVDLLHSLIFSQLHFPVVQRLPHINQTEQFLNFKFPHGDSHTNFWARQPSHRWLASLGMLSYILFFATPWTTACQASFSIGFSRQEY